MPFMSWNEQLSVKVQSIDEQHKKLIDIINKLHDAMKERKAKEVLGGVLQELINYTKYHFSNEENIFQNTQYIAASSHINQHNQFVNKVLDLQKDYNSGKAMLSLEVMNFLNDWLINHIGGVDKKYSEHFISHGIK